MAKRIKKGKSRIRTKTVTRRIYVKAKRAGRKAYRAAGEKMTTVDIVMAVGGAGVGSIGGSILLAKMPAAVPDIAKNGILAGLGGFLAYKGIKKKNRLAMGLGMGAAAAAATNIIAGVVGGSTVSGSRQLNAPYSRMLRAPYSSLNGNSKCLAAPLSAPRDFDTVEM